MGRFIGRLGVVSLPAVQAGLDLDERVVRRHVAKLEAAGCLERAAWVWGEGSIAWLTGTGVERAGLGGVRPVKAPPAPTTISHALLVGWSAARAEKRGRAWQSARELALDPDRWAVRMHCERGSTKQLPDLAVWLTRADPPIALVAESGGRREDRQKWILEGWRDAIYAGHYSAVLDDCADESVARWIHRLAKKAGLTRSDYNAVVQPRAAQIATLAPAGDEADGPAPGNARRSGESEKAPQSDDGEQSRVRSPAMPARATAERPAAPPAPKPKTVETAAERERRYRELLGIPEPKQRRRWRR